VPYFVDVAVGGRERVLGGEVVAVALSVDQKSVAVGVEFGVRRPDDERAEVGELERERALEDLERGVGRGARRR
jgi:hypothetical protein